ncbi:MAG: DUF937 domain-containing protein [Tannerella sp.]|jgi:hypothetical protein|nr:DUF937 domain-containing protein [Tannerella sp.]
MIDKLLGLVQEFAGSAVVENPAVPNSKNDLAVKSIADGILGGLKQEATGSGFGNIVGMLTKGGNVSSSVMNAVQGSVIDNLMSKVGISSTVAKSIAKQVVPSILGSLSRKAADAKNTHFDAGSILSSLTGGKTKGFDIQSLVDKGIGNGDGKLDLNDVISLLGKSQSSSGGNSGGGLLGALGGLLGGGK